MRKQENRYRAKTDLVIRLIRLKPYRLCKHMKDKVIDIFPLFCRARVDNWCL